MNVARCLMLGMYTLALGCELGGDSGSLVVWPDRISLLGPQHSRELVALFRGSDGSLARVDLTSLSMESRDPSIADVILRRVVARGVGETQIDLAYGGANASVRVDVVNGPPPFAGEVLEFRPGPGAGFGADRMPEVVLGPPQGGGMVAGSTDVVSLGAGGSIVLGFSSLVYNGPGPDLLVFENAFRIAGQGQTFGEPASVALAHGDGPWIEIPCYHASDPTIGCVGVAPVLANAHDPKRDPTDVQSAGGDAVDLALGMPLADRIRITDLDLATTSSHAAQNTAGFDLDAIALVNVISAAIRSIECDPSAIRLRRGESVAWPRVDAITDKGERLAGVQAAPNATSNPDVVRIDDGFLVAEAAGTATIRYDVGPFFTHALVEVLP